MLEIQLKLRGMLNTIIEQIKETPFSRSRILVSGVQVLELVSKITKNYYKYGKDKQFIKDEC